MISREDIPGFMLAMRMPLEMAEAPTRGLDETVPDLAAYAFHSRQLEEQASGAVGFT